MYVIDTRRSRYGSVRKQERQTITIRDSKVRVVICHNLRHNESNPSLDKEKYHIGGMRYKFEV